MIYIYRFFYALAKTICVIFKLLWPEPFQLWIDRRQAPIKSNLHFNSKSIWFHAASGEVEYVKNIITEIKKHNSQQKIVLTYTSPSIEKLLFNIKDQIDYIQPLPWDEPMAIKKLILLLNPKILVFAKTDFWPELIFQARKAGLPCGVVSYALNLKNKPTFSQRWALKHFQFIFVSDSSTAAKLKASGFDSTEAADTRFDQVFYRLNQPSRFQIQFSKPIITFGSTWPEDDHVLIKAVTPLIQLGYQIIWCPHDVSSKSIGGLKSVLQGRKFSIYSSYFNETEKKSPLNFTDDVLVIDQVGLLADIYRHSRFAFIGGSFKEKIHSVMEALCAGNLVFFGPHFQNNTEAIEFLNLNLAFSVLTAKQIIERIQSLDLNTQNEMQEKIRDLTSRKIGSSKKIAEFLLT